VLAVAMFLWGLGEGLFIYFYPPSLQHWGMDALQIGVVLSLIPVAVVSTVCDAAAASVSKVLILA
jgi:hypothetical protein